MLSKAFIPYGAYWSTPFCRWQGSLAEQHSVELAALVAGDFLAARKLDPRSFDAVLLGLTVPQRHGFYGAPWLAGMLGAPDATGATISQACATSARVIASAAAEIELGQHECVLAVACDRTSNGPHIYYPSGSAPGGRGASEDWVWDAFSHDPFARNAMIETAERVAREGGFTKEQQDEMSLLRYGQYEQALAGDRAFQRRYMFPVALRRGKKVVATVDADEGVHPTTAEGLAKLRPVQEGGSVTFGTQTHPADGNAGLVVCSAQRAAELSRDRAVRVRLRSYAQARVENGMMPKAVAPAARAALARAGIGIRDCRAVKTHNPFAVNDLLFCREMELAAEVLNRYGSPLVYGHPQGPTGIRLVVELVEELAQAGGGWGLMSGCAAGDTAMALVVEVG
ncbi:MAG: thiolase family protein [Deltaproteobacteria bacterium]|nr:thiolase family protein [Deltaproteobacteria bacterium]